MVERAAEAARRGVVFARLVLPLALRELLRGPAAEHVLGDLRRGRLLHRGGLGGRLLRATRGDQQHGEGKEGPHHWNLCFNVTSSRGFTSRLCACTGNVVFLTSILYLPGSSLTNFFGGETPCDLPFTNTSPHGVMLRNTVAWITAFDGSSAAGSSAFVPSAFTASAAFFVSALASAGGAAGGTCVGVGESTLASGGASFLGSAGLAG